jgi:hypothetical protein
MLTAPVGNEADDVARVRESRQQPDSVEHLYLTGRPTLKQFLRFVKDRAVHVPSSGDLADEWAAAEAVVRALQRDEAGCADDPVIRPVLPDNPLLLESLRNPLIRNSFNTVPSEIAYVELDRMVVYQHHIDVTFADELKRRLGTSPSEEETFRVCLPSEPPRVPATWARVHRNTFVFTAPSDDMRFLGAMSLNPENITDYPPPGNLVGVVGLAVGFGSNFVNAIYAENRLILNNGSHRVYALRSMGITHVPCIVQHARSRAELDVLASTAVTESPNFFLQDPRPMMVKDYFDSRLYKVVRAHRRLRQVTVKFDVDVALVPAL